MKYLLTIFTILITVVFSSQSNAEWTRVGNSDIGDVFYVDFERLRKHDGYVYGWSMNDLILGTSHGDMSFAKYQQSDCTLFRFKNLSYAFYQEPMGEGTPKVENSSDDSWKYPLPNSVDEIILKQMCSR